mgnify:FL=1
MNGARQISFSSLPTRRVKRRVFSKGLTMMNDDRLNNIPREWCDWIPLLKDFHDSHSEESAYAIAQELLDAAYRSAEEGGWYVDLEACLS